MLSKVLIAGALAAFSQVLWAASPTGELVDGLGEKPHPRSRLMLNDDDGPAAVLAGPRSHARLMITTLESSSEENSETRDSDVRYKYQAPDVISEDAQQAFTRHLLNHFDEADVDKDGFLGEEEWEGSYPGSPYRDVAQDETKGVTLEDFACYIAKSTVRFWVTQWAKNRSHQMDPETWQRYFNGTKAEKTRPVSDDDSESLSTGINGKVSDDDNDW